MSVRPSLAITAFLAAFAIMAPSLAQPGFDFMPDGGRELVQRLFRHDAAGAADLAAETHDPAGWQEILAGRADLSAKEIETLAGYLSVNFPLADGATAQDLSTRLPEDGKQLAIANCQTCHSIFSSYLMQRRNAQGWRSIFLSPFHREIKMNDKERETFALYSASNMPLAFEDVPAELRF